MEETKSKKVMDYSASAENLCNPPKIKEKLIELHNYQKQLKLLEDLLMENETYQQLTGYQKQIADITAQIKDMVDTLGSYQDTETGDYAVKYRRVSKSYKAEPFIDNYPKLAAAVIEQSVNVKALEGLVKGGLLNLEDMKAKGVVKESVSFAYYVR